MELLNIKYAIYTPNILPLFSKLYKVSLNCSLADVFIGVMSENFSLNFYSKDKMNVFILIYLLDIFKFVANQVYFRGSNTDPQRSC